MVRQGQDSASDRLGDGGSDREEGTDSSFAQVVSVTKKGLCRSGAVGAGAEVGAVPVGDGDLRFRVSAPTTTVLKRNGEASSRPAPDAGRSGTLRRGPS